MGLVKTLLIILLVYYGLKVLYRLFFPAFIKYAAKKAEQRFHESYKQRQTQQNSAKEGETSITKYPPKRANPNKKVGEYIDFEEIDEQK
jgi:hypothetical protein